MATFLGFLVVQQLDVLVLPPGLRDATGAYPARAGPHQLTAIRQPALILHSTQYHIVPPSSVKLFTSSLAGPYELAELERSFHVATIDFDQDVINERAVAFADLRTR
jgi:pimeloyl-ACP methyl ester carboxylesterase